MTMTATITVPTTVTLADVAAMAEADEHHRYELTAEGDLLVMTPRSLAHQRIIARLIVWLAHGGLDADQIFPEAGLYTGGGRQPDLMVWSSTDLPPVVEASYADATAGLLLVVEIVSKSTRSQDEIDKRVEYARIGVPRYWLIEQDGTQLVTMLELDSATGHYAAHGVRPLADLLTTSPTDALGIDSR